jgi:hypothetical protein
VERINKEALDGVFFFIAPRAAPGSRAYIAAGERERERGAPPRRVRAPRRQLFCISGRPEIERADAELEGGK